jgi:Ca2+-binding EF-hand superfamily protein
MLHDTQEVVVFAPNRPVRIRMTLLAEGRSVAQQWVDKLRAAFDYFDRNRDGFLDESEVVRVFSDQGLAMLMQNGVYQPTPHDRPSIDRLDTDGDRKVSFAEYVAYYKISTRYILRPLPAVPENPNDAALTEALFDFLDTDKDGKLSRAEVRSAETLLATLDTDEDECLSVTELIPNVANRRGRQTQAEVMIARKPPAATAASQTVATFEPGRIPGTLTQQLIKKYDRDGDFELTREESGFDEPTFRRLDRDGNGRLGGEELDEWRTGPPDLEVTLSTAPKAVDCVARLTTSRVDAAERGFGVRHSENGRLIIRTGRQSIEFWAVPSVYLPQAASKVTYQFLYTQAAGNRKFVTEKDLSGPSAVQFQFLRALFESADADGDGKLTHAEFDQFFDLHDIFRNIALGVTPSVQSPTLFQLLDENRDGRLSVRELRTAWDRLIALEPSGNQYVTKAAILPNVSLRLARNFDRGYMAATQFRTDVDRSSARPQKGPGWFQRMDRNGDGDVSRSEFLGTAREFDAIDTDHDGLISLEEAAAFDRKMHPVETKPATADRP